jgi:putative ABC transport system permease protein
VLFAVSNTLAMAVVERTREIGTLRAMGSLPSLIVRNFIIEGLVLGLSGALIGGAAAGAASLALDLVSVQMPPPPGRSVGYPLHVNFSPLLFAATALAIALAAAAAAWFVSRRASRMPIVEALTHV